MVFSLTNNHLTLHFFHFLESAISRSFKSESVLNRIDLIQVATIVSSLVVTAMKSCLEKILELRFDVKFALNFKIFKMNLTLKIYSS